MNWLDAIDFQILDALRDLLTCPFLDRVMPAVTWLGDSGWIWILIGIVLFFRKPSRRCGAAILGGLTTQLLIVHLILKRAIARPRPFQLREDISLLIPAPTDSSFPSGHTCASFLAAAVLLRYDKRLGIPALILAILIAFSRLYLYVHFPSDVLVGALLGLLIGYCAIRISEAVKPRENPLR